MVKPPAITPTELQIYDLLTDPTKRRTKAQTAKFLKVSQQYVGKVVKSLIEKEIIIPYKGAKRNVTYSPYKHQKYIETIKNNGISTNGLSRYSTIDGYTPATRTHMRYTGLWFKVLNQGLYVFNYDGKRIQLFDNSHTIRGGSYQTGEIIFNGEPVKLEYYQSNNGKTKALQIRIKEVVQLPEDLKEGDLRPFFLKARPLIKLLNTKGDWIVEPDPYKGGQTEYGFDPFVTDILYNVLEGHQTEIIYFDKSPTAWGIKGEAETKQAKLANAILTADITKEDVGKNKISISKLESDIDGLKRVAQSLIETAGLIVTHDVERLKSEIEQFKEKRLPEAQTADSGNYGGMYR